MLFSFLFFLLTFLQIVSFLKQHVLSSSYEVGIAGDKEKSDKSLCLEALT